MLSQLQFRLRLLRYYTPRVLINRQRIKRAKKMSRQTREPLTNAYPLWVRIEPSNLCNFRCPGCTAHTNIGHKENGCMDMDVYRSIIDSVAGKGTLGVLLWHRGEPLVHQQLAEMIEYAHSKNLLTRITSNLNLLRTAEDAERLVMSGLDWVTASLDGVTEEQYQKYRVGGRLEHLLNAIDLLREARERLGKKRPLLEIQFIYFPFNENDKDRAFEIAREHNVDRFYTKTAKIMDMKNREQFLVQNEEHARYRITDDGDIELKIDPPNFCHDLWDQLNIDWNGKVISCCQNNDQDMAFGNAANEDPIEIWRSKRASNLRRQILKDRKSIPMCRNCVQGLRV